MKNILLLLGLILSLSGFSQNHELKWGPINKAKSVVSDMYKIDGNSFYASTYGGRRSDVMLNYKNFVITSKTIYRTVVDKKPTSFEGRFEFDDRILIFTSQDNDDKTTKTLYVHEFRESAEEIDIEGKKLVSFDFDRKDKKRSSFSLMVSENKKKMCVTYISKQRKNNLATNYGYFILDSDLKVEMEGSFGDMLEPEVESIDEYKLSNTGELFVVTKVRKKDEPEYVKFYKVNEDDIKALEINLKGNYVNQLSIALDEKDNFVVSGFYGKPYVRGESKGTGVIGIFFVIMDPKTEEILNSGFNEFDQAFIMEGMTEKQKEKTEKRKEKKGEVPSLRNSYMRYFEATSDGGYFGVAEEYYVVITSYTDPKTGATRTTVTYYYNDLIAFKLNKEGEIAWKKKICKRQVSSNDGGFYSSFTHQKSGNHFYLLFNDNVANYHPTSKKFSSTETPESMRVSAKKNVIALVEIDIESGEIERKIIGGQKELGSILIPKLSVRDEKEPSILLYTKMGSKEKIGRISFDK